MAILFYEVTNKQMKLFYKSLILFLVLFLHSNNINAEQLKPFTTDGCSMFPDGTYQQNELWLSCCTAHDISYWQGGTYQQRLDADESLKVCVATVGQPEIAKLMLMGVRVGGSPYLPTTFRWGYGWSYPRLYGELNKEEQQQVVLLYPLKM